MEKCLRSACALGGLDLTYEYKLTRENESMEQRGTYSTVSATTPNTKLNKEYSSVSHRNEVYFWKHVCQTRAPVPCACQLPPEALDSVAPMSLTDRVADAAAGAVHAFAQHALSRASSRALKSLIRASSKALKSLIRALSRALLVAQRANCSSFASFVFPFLEVEDVWVCCPVVCHVGLSYARVMVV